MGEVGHTLAAGSASGSPATDYRLDSSFQPIYSVHEGTLAGHEALARPSDAAGRPVSTTALFASARGDEIVRIDRACRRVHLAHFASQDSGDGLLYLNIHPLAALEDARANHDLRFEVGLHGLRPSRVCIEILEDECGDEDRLAEAVAAYRAVGMKVAMDDFGIARSNFDRVAALKPDFVKIDRSLLVEAVGNAKARRLLPPLVGLLHVAGTLVIVEGIEKVSEALFAIESGADFLQGHYFGVPRPGLVADPLPPRLMSELKCMGGGRALLREAVAVEPRDISPLARLLAAGRALGFAG